MEHGSIADVLLCNRTRVARCKTCALVAISAAYAQHSVRQRSGGYKINAQRDSPTRAPSLMFAIFVTITVIANLVEAVEHRVCFIWQGLESMCGSLPAFETCHHHEFPKRSLRSVQRYMPANHANPRYLTQDQHGASHT